jgi:small subunit ribosomal protein S20
MANTKSAIKAFKQSEKRRLINKSRKSKVKTLINKCLALVAHKANQEEIVNSFKVAQSELHRAAGKGVIHKNTAARKISRLYMKINKK